MAQLVRIPRGERYRVGRVPRLSCPVAECGREARRALRGWCGEVLDIYCRRHGRQELRRLKSQEEGVAYLVKIGRRRGEGIAERCKACSKRLARVELRDQLGVVSGLFCRRCGRRAHRDLQRLERSVNLGPRRTP